MTPPTSSSPKARQAWLRSFVKTPVWRPKKLSLTWRMACVEVAEREGDDERGERLVRADLGGDRRVGEDRRGEERAVGLAAEEELAAEGDRLVDPALGPAGGGTVDHRPDVGRGVERIADLEGLRALDEAGHERVPDPLVDEHPLDADADLAGVGEGADEAAPDGPVEVGRLVDDDPGVAAELEDDLLLAGPLLHPPADRGAAGEAEELEPRIRHHPVAELAAHRQDADRAGRARRPPR